MTTYVATTLSQVPNVPAVYALYGGRGRTSHVAYVGVTDKLRQRISQHLVRRDSSVVTGVSVVSLDPNLVREVCWWEHSSFAHPTHVLAAESIAFDVLEPILRSRDAVEAGSRALAADAAFAGPIRALFAGEPSGRMLIPTLQDAMERIAALENRLAALERKLGDR